ncbi:uncharacterized protein Z520_03805 [Fonsecaea multimorphosa CBS 102226]|uniref:Uncharacterized protein n=1 Tax=Fonsecaea multimorphosa CBS 102226 TaxID=1442371 RepID=A0A0D2KAB2_9EURO|nr:uncharacterized protein Z520_03805 [Fonsecaea multimorphosa CBS 102226]KIY00120.1 hypothetical protein Z520_03805 [Fonsecaea multimorphosa CBS 102226]OAL27316.1 hypothetical protein AYO22_03591 [Fonsecaea multimorphosa]
MPPSITVEPIRASMLLDVEGVGGHPKDLKPQGLPPGNSTLNIQIEGLDRSFAALWRGGSVIGIGSIGEEEENSLRRKRSLILQTLAAALLSSQVRANASSPALPNVYLVTPHTSQTIPMLHVLLATTISDSQAAIELLRTVRVLQYFDLAGLAESLAEISQDLFRRTHATDEPVAAEVGRHALPKDIVVIQGLGETVSATHRRSGLVQSNALLGNLMRNITQISRISKDVLVLVEVALETGAPSNPQSYQEAARARRAHATIQLESVFAGPNGETLRLYSGHETLARTLEADLNCIVVAHDGFGRVKEKGRPNESSEQVVEVVKDRVGDLMGLWGIWKGG